MSKPKVTTNPGANQYAAMHERIIEYSNDKGVGGLISLRNMDDGTLLVRLYRHDDEVTVRVEGQTPNIEIVHGRHPDYGCDLTVFADGVRVNNFVEEDVDPGRGYERSTWDERIEDMRTNEKVSPAFREHALATLAEYGDSQYITD